MEAAVVSHGRCAVGQEIGNHGGIDAVSLGGVGIGSLDGVRPVLTPLLQVAFHAERDVGLLWCVHMGVDQAWKKELKRLEVDNGSIIEATVPCHGLKRGKVCSLDKCDLAVLVDAKRGFGQECYLGTRSAVNDAAVEDQWQRAEYSISPRGSLSRACFLNCECSLKCTKRFEHSRLCQQSVYV